MVSQGAGGLPLLPTKLVPPSLRSGVVQRDRLLDHLAAAAWLPVTLIAAPAGFGKTTLLAQWVGRLQSTRCGWVALDTGDRDVARFWSYVVAALRAAWPSLSADVIGRFRLDPRAVTDGSARPSSSSTWLSSIRTSCSSSTTTTSRKMPRSTTG